MCVCVCVEEDLAKDYAKQQHYIIIQQHSDNIMEKIGGDIICLVAIWHLVKKMVTLFFWTGNLVTLELGLPQTIFI